MPRFMKPNVSEEELAGKILFAARHTSDEYHRLDDDDDSVESALFEILSCWDKPKDLEKVDFSAENVSLGQIDNNEDVYELVHGSYVCWACACGDWEVPVYFVVYIDDKNKLRYYIPEAGNTYCHKCKCAYGSCECENPEYDNFDDDYPDPDFDAMSADVNNRLQIKG